MMTEERVMKLETTLIEGWIYDDDQFKSKRQLSEPKTLSLNKIQSAAPAPSRLFNNLLRWGEELVYLNYKFQTLLLFEIQLRYQQIPTTTPSPTSTHSRQLATISTPTYSHFTLASHPVESRMLSRRTAAKQFKDYQNPKKNNQFSPSPIKRYASSKSFTHHQSQSTQLENLNKENGNGAISLRNQNLSSAPSYSQTRGRRKPLQQLFNELKSSHSLEPSHNSDDEKVDINRKVSDLLKLERKSEVAVPQPTVQTGSMASPHEASDAIHQAIAATSLSGLGGLGSGTTRKEGPLSTQASLAQDSKPQRGRPTLALSQALKERKDRKLEHAAEMVEEVDSRKKKRIQKLQGKRVDSLVPQPNKQAQDSPTSASLNMLQEEVKSMSNQNETLDQEMMDESSLPSLMAQVPAQAALVTLERATSQVPLSLKSQGDIDESQEIEPKDMDIKLQQIEAAYDRTQKPNNQIQQAISSISGSLLDQSSALSQSSSASSQTRVHYQTPRNLVTALDGQRPLNINLTQNTLIMPHPNNPNAMQYSGRWTDEEHEKFLEGLRVYGKDWRMIEEFIGSRTCAQIRSHAQKYFNKLHRNQTKRAQKLLMAEKTLGKRAHHTKSAQAPLPSEHLVSEMVPSSPNVPESKLPFQVSHQAEKPSQAEVLTQINQVEREIQQSSSSAQIEEEKAREQLAQSTQNQPEAESRWDVDSELALTLRSLIQAREKVSLDFMLTKLSSVEACKTLIQITNSFHEQAMKALRFCRFDLSNRLVDERNLTQFICILLSKQVKILPPTLSSEANPEEEILQHVTASQASLVDDENAYPIGDPESLQSTLKRQRLNYNQPTSGSRTLAGTMDVRGNQTPDTQHALLMGASGRPSQPNFNLFSRGAESITPFKSLTKTPNPIHRLLPQEFQISELKAGQEHKSQVEGVALTNPEAMWRTKTNLASALGISPSEFSVANKLHQ